MFYDKQLDLSVNHKNVSLLNVSARLNLVL